MSDEAGLYYDVTDDCWMCEHKDGPMGAVWPDWRAVVLGKPLSPTATSEERKAWLDAQQQLQVFNEKGEYNKKLMANSWHAFEETMPTLPGDFFTLAAIKVRMHVAACMKCE